MQLKILNTYKIISRFALSLVGSFVPLIIYKITGVLNYAFLYIIAYFSLQILIGLCFKKLYAKYPQIFVVLRIIPIVLSLVAVYLMGYNFWIGVIMAAVFFAMSNSFQVVPLEAIYNYSSLDKGTSSLGITRLFERLGNVLGVFLGGIILDNISTLWAIVISIALYSLACVPLIIYYIKNKKDESFNKDAVSNVVITYNNDENKSKETKRFQKVFLLRYGIVFLFFLGINAFIWGSNLYFYLTINSLYSYCGFTFGIMQASFGIGSFIFGKIDDKYDTTKLFIVMGLINAIGVASVPFIKNVYLLIVVLFILGGTFAFTSAFTFAKMLQKSRIMGVSNRANFNKEMCALAASSFAYLIGLINIRVLFFAFSALCLAYVIYVPINEMKMKNLMVDFIGQNEIKTSSKKIKIKKEKRA